MYMQFILQAKQFLFVWNSILTATKFQKLVPRELQPLPQMALKFSFSRLLAKLCYLFAYLCHLNGNYLMLSGVGGINCFNLTVFEMTIVVVSL